MAEFIKAETIEHVAVVTLDNGPLNLIVPQVFEEIIDVFGRLGADEDVAVVVFTGAGDRAFSAGGDMRVAVERTQAAQEASGRLSGAGFDAIYGCAVPVIGAVNGYALGGGLGLAASCDILIASERAVFGLPEIDVGMLGCFRHLSRLVPELKARRMAYTGQRLTAHEVERYGGIEKVVPHEDLMPTTMQLAREIAKKSGTALRLYKEALNRTELPDMGEAYRTQMEYTVKLAGYSDYKETKRAFLDKRGSESSAAQ